MSVRRFRLLKADGKFPAGTIIKDDGCATYPDVYKSGDTVNVHEFGFTGDYMESHPELYEPVNHPNALAVEEQQTDCEMKDGLLTPCVTLAKAASDYQGHYKKGLSVMPITQFRGGEFKHVKDYVIVKNGEFAKNGIVCNYCPFCGGILTNTERRAL